MSTFGIGYGTNGFADHRLGDAIRIIHDLGYTGVALTLDHQHLDPFASDVARQVEHTRRVLADCGLRVVVETGARYLLDPRHKHQPTLLSADASARVDFLCRAIRIAEQLGAECVSLWSGVAPAGTSAEVAWHRLLAGMSPVLAEAGSRGVRLAFEPEPGHLVARLADAERLRDQLGAPETLGFTIDVGHCVAVEPQSAPACLRRAGALLFNVHLDDMLPGVHEHLEFGTGQLDLVGTMTALHSIGYAGLATVELPRHSHAAPEVAARSMRALREAGGCAERAGLPGQHWLDDAECAIRADPKAIRTLFPAVGREVGREPVRRLADPEGLRHGTVDDMARGRLLCALAESMPAEQLPAEVEALYRHGDAAERRGVLRALHLLPDSLIATGRSLVRDALRSNDTRLVAAAMGRFAAGALEDNEWRHGVLKCLFTAIPIDVVAELAERTDAELIRMVSDFAAERTAAGRPVPVDVKQILQEAPE